MCRHQFRERTGDSSLFVLVKMTIRELLPKLEEEASVGFEVRKANFACLLEYTQI